tara:strand:+ start:382 stop:1515 length:1134 start_codon:yes stop_codon:yes gene_type:complete
MSGPVVSPDGKHVWNGKEWLPFYSNAPNIQDSVIMGDVNTNFTQNISHVDTEEVVSSMIEALRRLGISKETQDIKIDDTQKNELKKIIETSESLHKRGRVFSAEYETKIAHASKLIGDLRTAETHYIRALEYLQLRGYEQDIIAAMGNLGTLYCTIGQLNKAENIFRKLKIYVGGNQLFEAITRINLASVFLDRDEYDTAYSEYKESFRISSRLGNQELMCAALAGTGQSLIKMNKLLFTSIHIKRSLRMSKRLNHTQYETINLTSLGDYYLKKGKYDKSSKYYHKAKKLCLKEGFKQELIYIEMGFADLVLKQKNDFSSALEYLKNCLHISRNYGYELDESNIMRELGKIYHLMGNQTESNNWIEQSSKKRKLLLN